MSVEQNNGLGQLSGRRRRVQTRWSRCQSLSCVSSDGRCPAVWEAQVLWPCQTMSSFTVITAADFEDWQKRNSYIKDWLGQTFSDLSESRSISLNRSRKWFLIDFRSLLKTEDWAKKSLTKMLKIRSITFLGGNYFSRLLLQKLDCFWEKLSRIFFICLQCLIKMLSLVKWQFSKLCNMSPCFFNFIFFQIVARFSPKYGCFQ